MPIDLSLVQKVTEPFRFHIPTGIITFLFNTSVDNFNQFLSNNEKHMLLMKHKIKSIIIFFE